MQDCCIKIRIYKVISIFVSLYLLISNISITAYCTENVNEMTLDTFYDELTIMLNAGENYSSIIRVESTESGETITEDKISTNRLIVSTDSNEDLPKNYGAISRIEGYNNWHIFQYSTYENASQAYKMFSLSDEINYVEFDEIINIEDTEIEPVNNENYTPLSWGAECVESVTTNEAILSSGKKLPRVVVAIIDTGVDSTHDFFNMDPSNPRILKGNRTNDNVAHTYHGTHVAGIVADNTLPNVKIKSYNYFYYQNQEINGTVVSLATEIHSAVQNSVDVINMSLGAWDLWVESDTIINEIASAVNKNIPVVVAAGNNFTNASLKFPANDINVITVAAVSKNKKPAAFSNFGDCVDIAAPGVDINSTIPSNAQSNNNYKLYNGTSMAAPFVSAAVAMMKTLNPDITVTEIKEKLIESVEIPEGWSGRYGAGILNFENIIKEDRLATPTITLRKTGATISSSEPNVEIYYTTDGTTPVIGESPTYLGTAIDTSNIKYLKAVAYKSGELPSYMITQSLVYSTNITVRYKGTESLPTPNNHKIERCYSSNEEKVVVDSNGNITGVCVGNATVTAFLENNQIGTYNITVEYAWWQQLIRIFLLGFLWY